MDLLIYLLLFFSSVVRVPDSVVPQSGSSRALSKDGKVRWAADWSMERNTSPVKTVKFLESGSGDLDDFSRQARWSVEAVWLADSNFSPLDIKKTVTASDGTPLLLEEKHFDHAKGVVRFDRRRGSGKLETSTLTIPADTLAIEGLAGILRFVPFDDHRSFDAHVMTNEPKIYSVTFEWRGVEKIKTPAGEFECYKIEMVPHLGVMNIIRPFVSKTFLWFTVAEPHYWVRYAGAESGPNSRSIVMELTRNSR